MTKVNSFGLRADEAFSRIAGPDLRAEGYVLHRFELVFDV